MDRASKHALVDNLSQTLKQQTLLVLTRQTGLDVGASESLRCRAREAGASYRVVKNTLLKLALSRGEAEGLADHVSGPMGLSYSEDPIAAAKVSVDFAKEHKKFEVVAGFLDGNVLDAEGVKTLASLPSLDALRGQIVGLVVAPASGMVRTVSAPGAGLARLMQAYSEKK